MQSTYSRSLDAISALLSFTEEEQSESKNASAKGDNSPKNDTNKDDDDPSQGVVVVKGSKQGEKKREESDGVITPVPAHISGVAVAVAAAQPLMGKLPPPLRLSTSSSSLLPKVNGATAAADVKVESTPGSRPESRPGSRSGLDSRPGTGTGVGVGVEGASQRKPSSSTAAGLPNYLRPIGSVRGIGRV